MEWEERLSAEESFLSLQPSSWLNIDLITPAGQKVKYRTRYVGYIDSRYLLIEMPDAQKYDKSITFFQPGMKMTVRGIIEGTEGAVIGFIAKLSKIVLTPIKMLVLDLPQSVQYLSLRAQSRYRVTLPTTLLIEDIKANAMMVDVSTLGCLIYVKNTSNFEIEEGQKITLKLDKDAVGLELSLHCTTRSIRPKDQYVSYGLEFDQESSDLMSKSIGKVISFNTDE